MKYLLLLLAVILSIPSAWGDEIHLNDGRVINGKIIKVTPKTVEYDPEGPRILEIFPRGQIFKIVFDNGSMIILNEKGADDIKRSEEKTGNYNIHEGIFLRMLIGGAGGTALQKDVFGNELKLKGGARMFSIHLGFTLFNSLNVFGSLTGYSISEAEVEINNVPVANTQAEFGLGESGIGLNYYIMPSNFYLSAALTFPAAVYKLNGIESTTKRGRGLYVSVGKEWWVSDNWALGLALFAQYGVMSVEDTGPVKDKLESGFIGLALSATYN